MAQFNHQQLDSILQRALELPEEARDAFLPETCGNNAEPWTGCSKPATRMTRCSSRAVRWLAAFNTASGTLRLWDPGADARVNVLAIDAGTVYAGGSFAQAGGAVRRAVAAFNAESGSLRSWSPDPNGPVSTLTIAAGKIHVGGNFTEAGGAPRGRLASFDADPGPIVRPTLPPTPPACCFDDAP